MCNGAILEENFEIDMGIFRLRDEDSLRYVVVDNLRD